MTTPDVNNFSAFNYDLLHFIPTSVKDDLTKNGPGYQWAANNINFLDLETVELITESETSVAKLSDLGKILENEYKNVIDPKIEGDANSGKAEYFYADWKSNPIYLHLNRIIDAKLAKTDNQIQIKAADDLSKSKRHKENERIINRDWTRAIINKLLSEAGLPTIGKDEDPNKYIEKLKNAEKENEKKPKKIFKSKQTDKMDDAVLDDIINSISDNEGLAIYQNYIYRTDSEIAVEEGAKYYLSINNWRIIKNAIIRNIRNHNTYAIKFYTSQTTGLPVIENVDFSNETFRVLPFSREDGMDCAGFIHEKVVTFGTFVRMFGSNLSKQELVDIFNATRGNSNERGYNESNVSQRENAKIRIGYAEWETQNMEVYRVGYNQYGNYVMNKKKEDYVPPKNSPYKKEARNYNVWYKCYFIKTNGQGVGSNISKTMVFDYGKVQDQQRFGEDGRLSKSSYIIYKNHSIPPINEIILRYMKLINLIWFRVQNDIGNDSPHIQVFVAEAISNIMQHIDSGEIKKGSDAAAQSIRVIKQTGRAIMNGFDRISKTRIDKPIIDVESGYMKSATEKLVMIGNLYSQMMQAVGINDISEGSSPKPRQALGAIEMANEASNNSRYFLEEAMLNCDIEMMYRFLYYFHEIVNSNDKDRIAELENIVGEANSKALSGIADIPFHSLGIYVDKTNEDLLKSQVLEMAISEYKKGTLNPSDYLELLRSENVKLSIAILQLKIKQREKKMQEQQDKNFQQQMALQQQDTSMKAELQKVLYALKDSNIITQGKVDEQLERVSAQLQTDGSLQVKDKIKENKLEEMETANNLDIKNKIIGVS